MEQACPRCGAARIDAGRRCPTCHYDFALPAAAGAPRSGQSFTERFRGTAWESPAVVFEPALPARISLLPLVGLAAILLAFALGLLLASRSGWLDAPVGIEVFALGNLLIPFVAGTVSKVVPGSKARGPFKGWLVAYMGWYVANLIVFMINGFTLPSLPIPASFMVDHLLLATAGALGFRTVLLVFE